MGVKANGIYSPRWLCRICHLCFLELFSIRAIYSRIQWVLDFYKKKYLLGLRGYIGLSIDDVVLPRGEPRIK